MASYRLPAPINHTQYNNDFQHGSAINSQQQLNQLVTFFQEHYTIVPLTLN